MSSASPVTDRPSVSASSEGPTNGFTAVNDRSSPPNGAPSGETNGRPRSSHKDSWPHANGDSSHPENQNKRRHTEMEGSDHSPSLTSPSRSRMPVDPDIDPRMTQGQPGAPRDPRWDPDESRMADLLRQENGNRMEMSSPEGSMKPPGHPDSSSLSRPSGLVMTPAGVHQDPSKKRKRAFTNRTKTGCQTCRKRKKKCDEGKPECQNCLRGGFQCLGYTQRRDISGKQPLSIKANVPIQSRQYWEHNARSSPHAGYESSGMSMHSTPDARHPIGEESSSHARPFPSWNGSSINGPPRPGERMSEMRSLPPIYNSRNSYAPMMATEHARAALRVGWDNNRGSPLPGTDNSNETQYGNIGLFKPQESLRTARRKACLKACSAFNNAATMNMSDTELQRLFSQIVHPEPATSGTSHDPHKQTNRLGKDVRVEAPFRAEMGENLHIGDGVSIDSGCYFKDSYTMYIANNTRIGANVTISAEWVPPDPKWREWSRGVIVRIGENVYIGPNVTISPSGPIYKPEIVIGDEAYIAAGTVVSRDVPKGAYIVPSYTFSTAQEAGGYDERSM